MTDGPFKNLKLDKRSRQFVVAVQQEMFDRDQCCALAQHAILGSVLSESKSLIPDLYNYSRSGQLDFDPSTAVLAIFERHDRSQFGDQLRRETEFRLTNGQSLRNAIANGLETALEHHIALFNNRNDDECQKARATGEMQEDQFSKYMSRSRQVLGSIDYESILSALQRGDINAFKKKVSKRKGLDEGPAL